jgi:hypothetical protein
MIITSNDPKHRSLGRTLETYTTRMVLISQYRSLQTRSSSLLFTLIQDLENNKEDLDKAKQITEAMRIAVGLSNELFEEYRTAFVTADQELEKLVREQVKKDLTVTPPPVPANLSDLFPAIPAVPVVKSEG